MICEDLSHQQTLLPLISPVFDFIEVAIRGQDRPLMNLFPDERFRTLSSWSFRARLIHARKAGSFSKWRAGLLIHKRRNRQIKASEGPSAHLRVSFLVAVQTAFLTGAVGITGSSSVDGVGPFTLNLPCVLLLHVTNETLN